MSEPKRTQNRVFASLKPLLSPTERPVTLRYLIPIVLMLVLVLFLSLPIVSFRTVGGESDPQSVFSWMHASFFGANGSRGAWEALTSASAGNQNLGFYRAVVVTYLLSVLAFVLGTLLSVAHSVIAVYLLLTKEKTERSHTVGRFFRVVFGGRLAILFPYILTLVPFVFPHLFAYFYTVLVPYDTAVASRFDPLIVALLVLFVEILLILWAKPYELRSEYQIFRSPRRHIATEKERRLEEEREWEAEVRADALSADDPSDLPDEEDGESIDTPEEPQAAAEDESLYDREFVLSEEASAESAEKAPEEPTSHDGQSEEELRRSIASLFSDDDAPSQNKKKRK